MSAPSNQTPVSQPRRIVRTLSILILALSAAAAQAADHGDEQYTTDFEGVNTQRGESFEIGEGDATATFGGQAFSGSLGDPAFYHSGQFAWMVDDDGTGTIELATPASSVTFFARAADPQSDDGGGGGPYGTDGMSGNETVLTALDADGATIDEVTITSESFQEIHFSGGVARIEVVNRGADVNSIDDFGFTPAGMDGGMAINKGHAGAWLNPETAGQGVFVGVFDQGGDQPPGVFAAWFTFDSGDGATKFAGEGQRWFVGQGAVSTDDPSTAEVTLFQTTGGSFNQPFPDQPPSERVGSMTLGFEDCSSGSLSFELFAEMDDTPTLSGDMNIQRVTGDPSLCQEIAGTGG